MPLPSLVFSTKCPCRRWSPAQNALTVVGLQHKMPLPSLVSSTKCPCRRWSPAQNALVVVGLQHKMPLVSLVSSTNCPCRRWSSAQNALAVVGLQHKMPLLSLVSSTKCPYRRWSPAQNARGVVGFQHKMPGVLLVSSTKCPCRRCSHVLSGSARYWVRYGHLSRVLRHFRRIGVWRQCHSQIKFLLGSGVAQHKIAILSGASRPLNFGDDCGTQARPAVVCSRHQASPVSTVCVLLSSLMP